MIIDSKWSQLCKAALLATTVTVIGCTGGGTSTGDGSSGGGGTVGGGGLGGLAPVTSPGSGGSGGASGDTPSGGAAPNDPNVGSSGTDGGAGGGGGGGGADDGGGGSGGADGSVSIDPGTGGGTTRATASYSATSDTDGFATVALTLANTNAFQVVSEVASNLYLLTLELISPTGITRLDADNNNPPFTLGISGDSSPNNLPYQTKGDDPAVESGTYTQRLGVVQVQGSSVNGVSAAITGTLVAKNDSNLSNGTVRVNIFLFGDEAQKGSTETALDEAIDIWREIYDSSSFDLSLSINTFDISGSGILPNPSLGSDFYYNAATGPNVPGFAVNVFIGDDVSADASTVPGNSLGVLGVASSIPGPAIPTRKSAVAVSLLSHEGIDGAFSAEEIALLGETLAHEAGHYLGLFHPVEVSGFQTFTTGDRLGDTATCSTLDQCVANQLALNNMFPTPVPGIAEQRNLSSNQRQVMNLQAIVD